MSAYTLATKLDKLARIARTLHRLYEDACNVDVHACPACGGPDDDENHRRARQGKLSYKAWKHTPTQCHYARCERLESRAKSIGAELGIVVTHQRDPRGAPIKLWADNVDGRSLGYFGGGR